LLDKCKQIVNGATGKLFQVNLKEAVAIAGSLGVPSKMPGYAYGLPAGKADWLASYIEQDASAPENLQGGCPVGAKLQQVEGSVCHKCYATKGNYAFKNVRGAQYARLKGLYHPQWIDAMVELLYMKVDPNVPYFRWHDSGDLLGVWHLAKIVEVCKRTKAVKHWLPTREAKMVQDYILTYGALPGNLTVRVSATMVDGIPVKSFPNISTVHSTKEPIGFRCKAPSQENNCGACRACWDKRIRNISYAKH
jgi:hypothetical protein